MGSSGSISAFSRSSRGHWKIAGRQDRAHQGEDTATHHCCLRSRCKFAYLLPRCCRCLHRYAVVLYRLTSGSCHAQGPCGLFRSRPLTFTRPARGYVHQRRLFPRLSGVPGIIKPQMCVALQSMQHLLHAVNAPLLTVLASLVKYIYVRINACSDGDSGFC